MESGRCRLRNEADMCSIEAVGLARIKEALEANDWEGTGAVEGDGEDADPWELGEGQDTIGGDMQAGDEAFSVEVGARTKEMRVPILSPQEHLNAIFNSNLTRDEIDEDDEGDFQVQELERMMLKIQAVKGKPCCLISRIKMVNYI